MGKADFAWLDALRRQYYPADRNRVPAHLTLFHALPPSAEHEARRSLARGCAGRAPKATLSGVMDLGGGVALRIHSDELDLLREELASEFYGLLSARDRGGWVPHVTIQNKVERQEARALAARLEQAFRPRPLSISGLLLIRYVDGAWEPLGNWKFRG